MELRRFAIETDQGNTRVVVDGVDVTGHLLAFTVHQGSDIHDRIPTLTLKLRAGGTLEALGVVEAVGEVADWFDGIDPDTLTEAVLGRQAIQGGTFGGAALQVLKEWATGAQPAPPPDNIVTADNYEAHRANHANGA